MQFLSKIQVSNFAVKKYAIKGSDISKADIGDYYGELPKELDVNVIIDVVYIKDEPLVSYMSDEYDFDYVDQKRSKVPSLVIHGGDVLLKNGADIIYHGVSKVRYHPGLRLVGNECIPLRTWVYPYVVSARVSFKPIVVKDEEARTRTGRLMVPQTLIMVDGEVVENIEGYVTHYGGATLSVVSPGTGERPYMVERTRLHTTVLTEDRCLTILNLVEYEGDEDEVEEPVVEPTKEVKKVSLWGKLISRLVRVL